MTLCDFNGDGNTELAVGSDDYAIRYTSYTHARAHTHPHTHTKFAYGLANGTVGVYMKDKRVWRVKSKNQVLHVKEFTKRS